jgi:hypothetical protein
VVHEHLTHDTGGDGEEVRPAVPVEVGGARQPQIGFVDQAARLQRMAAALAPHVAAGLAPQLTVKDREELFARGFASLRPGTQQRRNRPAGWGCGTRSGMEFLEDRG